MEAGAAAGPAAGDAAGEGQEQQQQEQAQQQPGISPELAEQLGAMPQQLEQMREWMEQSQAAQQASSDGADQQEQSVDLSFVNPESPSYDPERAAQELLGVLQSENAKALQEAVQPLQQQISEQQSLREAELLTQEFPELAETKAQDALMQTTAQWVEQAGLPPEAAGNMQVVRAVFMMGRAAELHNDEQAGDGAQAATLEGAGGASPGGTGGGLTAESIIGNNGRRSPLPFG